MDSDATDMTRVPSVASVRGICGSFPVGRLGRAEKSMDHPAASTQTPSGAGPGLLEMRRVTKSYPGVVALRGVDLTLGRGEVLALVGENGAGKSTLMKVLGGAVRPDSGEIRIDGRLVTIRSPSEGQQLGIAIIYQEFNLIPGLSALANIFLGSETTVGGWIRSGQERRLADELFQRLGVSIDPHLPCRRLTVAQQQVVEIAKALARKARIIVMDEPTAPLTPHEVTRLFAVIRELKAQGIGIIYISHRLEEVFSLADRITVLRDGENVGERPTRELTRATLIEMMVGRKLNDEFPARTPQIGPPRFVVKNLTRGEAVRDVSLEIRRGEVLGLTGLVGAGRTETARLLFGADRRDRGQIILDGRELRVANPRDAIRAGLGLLTEDRKNQGLVLPHTVHHNFGLPNLPWLSRLGILQQRRELDSLSRYIDSLRIKVTGPEQRVRDLSGGNQQKVVLAKWLARQCNVLIFDEPTRGIDVGAKYEIYVLINELAQQGKSILLISSELPEILGMSDRILVMHGGRITGEIPDARSATQEQIMELAIR